MLDSSKSGRVSGFRRFNYFLIFLFLLFLSGCTDSDGAFVWSRQADYCSSGTCDGDLEVPSINITEEATFNGQIFFENDSRVKRELIFKGQAATKGASAPTDVSRAIGAGGDVSVPVISFSKVTQQEIFGSFHPPSDIDDSENISVHLMWMPGAAYTGGNYVWILEYLIKEEHDPTDIGMPVNITLDITPTNGTEMIESEFGETIDLNNEQVVYIHFFRDVANDNADDTGEIIFFEAEYVVNRLGLQVGEVDV